MSGFSVGFFFVKGLFFGWIFLFSLNSLKIIPLGCIFSRIVIRRDILENSYHIDCMKIDSIHCVLSDVFIRLYLMEKLLSH